jgi:hypothetical protein
MPSLRHWIVALIVVLGIVALLGYARNEPGVGGRVPDPEDVNGSVVIDGLGTAV